MRSAPPFLDFNALSSGGRFSWSTNGTALVQMEPDYGVTSESGFRTGVGGVIQSASGTVSILGDAQVEGAVTAASVTTNAGGTTRLNGNVTTTGTQTYNDAVELQSDIILTTTDSAVSFGGPVNAEATEGNSLTITAGAGDVSFAGAVGGAPDGHLGVLTISSAHDVTAAAISAESLQQLAGSGRFGRFVVRLLDRTNRARNVLVLLIAGALAGGCG